MYDPSLGRFLQTDPIGYEDDKNLYAYVYNDPLNKTDPTGLCANCLGALIGGGIAATAQLIAEVATGELDGAAVQRIGVAAGIGMAAGATGAGVAAVGNIVARAAATMGIGAGGAAASRAAQVSLTENRAPTASELKESAKLGALTAGLGAAAGGAAKQLGTQGPAVFTAAGKGATSWSLEGSVNSSTLRAYTEKDLAATRATQAAAGAFGTAVDNFSNAFAERVEEQR